MISASPRGNYSDVLTKRPVRGSWLSRTHNTPLPYGTPPSSHSTASCILADSYPPSIPNKVSPANTAKLRSSQSYPNHVFLLAQAQDAASPLPARRCRLFTTQLPRPRSTRYEPPPRTPPSCAFSSELGQLRAGPGLSRFLGAHQAVTAAPPPRADIER